MDEFTEKDFDELFKRDPRFAQQYRDYLSFELWLAQQSASLQQEIDHACKEYVSYMLKDENPF